MEGILNFAEILLYKYTSPYVGKIVLGEVT